MTHRVETEETARRKALVEDAFARGEAALARGDNTDAVRWLDRASRLAPGENTIRLVLASAWLGLEPARAAELFEQLVEAVDLRDAWLGLATARFLGGDIPGTRAALQWILSRHALRDDLVGLANAMVLAADSPGWCGLTGLGEIAVHARKAAFVEIAMDGVRVLGRILPEGWRTAAEVAVTVCGTHLPGSPLCPRAIGRAEGFVDTGKGGLHGWVWHPADPEIDPVLTVRTQAFRMDIAVSAPASGVAGLPPMARPRAFSIPWSMLPKGRAPVHVFGADGRPLHGAPVPRNLTSLRTSRHMAGPPPDRVPAWHPVVAVAPDAGHLIATKELAGIAQGDIASAAKAWPGHDLVILEEGVRLPRNWLARLRKAAYASPDIGTVSVFSNRGVVDYPGLDGPGIDRLARKANGARIVAIPVASGPCIFIRRDCLDSLGTAALQAAVLGPGVPVTLCAMAPDWNHVALPGLFVSQPKISPPNAPGLALSARNERLSRLIHPGLDVALDRFREEDPLSDAKRRFDLSRWNESTAPGAIFVTHDDGGGVERRVSDDAAAWEAQGGRAIVLRPATLSGGEPGVAVSGAGDRRFPNLTFAMPKEKAKLRRFLLGSRPRSASLHHFLNHDPATIETVLEPGLPYDVHVHDFIWFCPRIALVGQGDRYCQEPGIAGCETCISETGSFLREPISVTALRERSGRILRGARRVVAPSGDAAARMRRHFPGLLVAAEPHEDDDSIPEPPPVTAGTGPVRICTPGGIGLHKGYHVLLACARNARERGLNLMFDVVGSTIDDQSLIDTGHVFVTGPYRANEAETLIRARNATLGFLPSIWPETWTFALTELWRAGLRVAAFDLGAPAERIRRTGRGFLLPLHSPPSEINDVFLNAAKGDLFFRSRALRPTSLTNAATQSK